VVSPRIPVFLSTATATAELYTLSLHDALPISSRPQMPAHAPASSSTDPVPSPCQIGSPAPPETPPRPGRLPTHDAPVSAAVPPVDRKSTRLNSSHVKISYAVFCLKKKIKRTQT